MFEKLQEIEDRFEELTQKLGDPDIATNPDVFRVINKERSDLEELVEKWREYKELDRKAKDAANLLDDDDEDMRQLAKEELSELQDEKSACEKKLKHLLLPKDPNDGKNILLEIRAGTGGNEAALFAGDLFRMYGRFAETKRWKVETLSSSPNEIGGFKEIVATISGKDVYSHLKYESGVHRVQRVPVTESQGRIHTSAATVAVLPEAEDADIEVRDEDLRIDVYRSSGAGGQHVNTSDSAVRITHLPTNLVVTCQDERSQIKNKSKAMKILRAKLLEIEQQKVQQEQADNRKAQVGSGDRSERVRTYNFPQGRLTDHRIGLTLYKLDEIVEGNLEDVIIALRTHFQAEALKAGSES